MRRRRFLLCAALIPLALLTGCAPPPGGPASPGPEPSAESSASVEESTLLEQELAELESRYAARIGVQVVGAGTGERLGYP